MSPILWAVGLVVAYVLILLLRVIFFPRKPPAPIKYEPRQVRLSDRHFAILEWGSRALVFNWDIIPSASSHTGVIPLAPILAWPSLLRRRSPPAPPRPGAPAHMQLPCSLQIGDVTLLELSKYDGRDPMRPILLAIRGRVFDVTMGRAFYGPGGVAEDEPQRTLHGTSSTHHSA